VRGFLHGQFGQNVISYKMTDYGGIEYPPKSPDLTVMDFYLFPRLKTLVFQSGQPKTVDELK
jgi:hypothetical protein